MFGQTQGQVNTFDITETGYIERIVVGARDPGHIPDEAENRRQMDYVNRCLSEYPKGRIIGVERSFSVVRIGEHQVVLESVAYHVGFKKKPLWIEAKQQETPRYAVDPDKVESVLAEAAR